MQIQHKIKNGWVSESIREDQAIGSYRRKGDANPLKIFTNPLKNLPSLHP